MADNDNAAVDTTTTENTETAVLSDNANEGGLSDNSTTGLEPNQFGFVPEKFLKEDKTPDWEKMAHSYTELEKTLRSTRPTAPKSIDEYELEDFDLALDDELSKGFREEALKAGVSTEQYKWIMGKYRDLVMESMPNVEKASAVLSKEWGENFEANINDARKAFSAYGEGIDEASVGNNPEMLKILARIGAEMKEDSSIQAPASGTGNSGLTETEVSELMARDDYWTNKEIQAKVQSFFNRSK